MVLGVLTNPTLPIVTSIPIYSAMFLRLDKDRHRCSNDKRKYERETRHHRLPEPSQMFQKCQVHMQLRMSNPNFLLIQRRSLRKFLPLSSSGRPESSKGEGRRVAKVELKSSLVRLFVSKVLRNHHNE